MARGSLSLITLSLKAFTAFWAFITWVVAAAFVGRMNSLFGSGEVMASNYTSANALLACGLLAMFYILGSLFFILRSPDHILISVLVDSIFYGIFFIFALGSSAGLSTEASVLSDCSLSVCSLGRGVIGIGWVFAVLLLAIFLLEVIYTFTHYGSSLATWRTPFAQLLEYGHSSNAGATNPGDVPPPVAMSNVHPSQQQPHMQQSTTHQGYTAQQTGQSAV